MSPRGAPKQQRVIAELRSENAQLARLIHENALLQADQRLLASIVETSDDAIISKNLDGFITSWNASAESMFGYSSVEAIGKHISILFPPDRIKEEEQIIARLKAGHKIEHYETVRLKQNGREVWVSLSVAPIYDGAGFMTGASKVVRDITAVREAAATTRALQNELAHVGRMSAMGLLSAAIAHELNQPLAAINNYALAAHRLIENDAPPPENLNNAREAMKKTSAQAVRAGDIIRNLRGFMDKREGHRTSENLTDLINESVSLAMLGYSKIKVSLVLDTAIPLLLLDRIQIQQVMLNLIRNGAEAMADTPSPTLTITSAMDSVGVSVTVRDNGPGFAPEIVGRIFQPFATSKKDGMGMGLRICQSIVEAHCGTIQAFDGNSGAVLVVRLPWNLAEKGEA